MTGVMFKHPDLNGLDSYQIIFLRYLKFYGNLHLRLPTPATSFSSLSYHSAILLFIPLWEPLHFLDLHMYPVIPEPPPPTHTGSCKTSAGVAEFAGCWEDRRSFRLQKHKKISVAY